MFEFDDNIHFTQEETPSSLSMIEYITYIYISNPLVGIPNLGFNVVDGAYIDLEGVYSAQLLSKLIHVRKRLVPEEEKKREGENGLKTRN